MCVLIFLALSSQNREVPKLTACVDFIYRAIVGQTGPEPAIGTAIVMMDKQCISLNKLGGVGACSTRKIRHSEIASEVMFGPKCY